MEQLLQAFENEYDRTNLLDVSSALSSLYVTLQQYRKEADKGMQEEYGNYVFYVDSLLEAVRSNPNVREKAFITARGILISCIELKNQSIPAPPINH